MSGLVKIGKIGELKRHIYPLRSIGVLGQWGKGERELLRAEEKYLPKLANDLPKVSYCIEPLCCGFAVFSYRLKTHTHTRAYGMQSRTLSLSCAQYPFFHLQQHTGRRKKKRFKDNLIKPCPKEKSIEWENTYTPAFGSSLFSFFFFVVLFFWRMEGAMGFVCLLCIMSQHPLLGGL